MSDQIVDACCLINLYAAGNLEKLLAGCGGTFHVSDEVRSEATVFRQPDPENPSLLVPAPIDLSPVIARGLIQRCRLEDDDEIALFVEYVSQIDDGEASCLAIAKSRGWMVATDDRKAIRLASASGIAVVTTPELVKRWVNSGQPPANEIVQVVRNIERFARFRPRAGSPLYDWWTGLVTAQ